MQRPYKTPEEYSRSIKILKYNIQELVKENERLKLEQRKQEREKARKKNSKEPEVEAFKVDQAVKAIYSALKKKGIPLEGVFRMANAEYQKEIPNEKIIKMLDRMKVNLAQKDIMKLVTAIDTSANGKISESQFETFIHTYGVGDDNQTTIRLQADAYHKFSSHFRSHNKIKAESLFDEIDRDGSGTIDTQELSSYCKSSSVHLNSNEIFLVMRYMDPGREGKITKNKFVSCLLIMNKKEEVDKTNEDFQKEMKIFKAKIVQNKVNPFELFDEADLEDNGQTSPQELLKVFKKHFPRQTPATIKKWIELVNYNKDEIIERSQFLNIITEFFSPQELDKMRVDSKAQVQVKFTYKSAQKLLQQFNNKIQDMSMKRIQVFQILNTNGDQFISTEEFKTGLKQQFALDSPFVINLMKVFDKDNSGGISMNEFLKILGEDVQFDEVQMEDSVVPGKKPVVSKGKNEKDKVKGGVKDQKNKDVSKVIEKVTGNKKKESKIEPKQSVSKEKPPVSKQKPVSKVIEKKQSIKETKKQQPKKETPKPQPQGKSEIKKEVVKKQSKKEDVKQIVKKESKEDQEDSKMRESKKPETMKKKVSLLEGEQEKGSKVKKQEKDESVGKQKVVEKKPSLEKSNLKEKEKQKEREKQKQKQKQKQKEKQKEREKQKAKEKEREKQKEKQIAKQKQKEKERQKQKEKEREKEKKKQLEQQAKSKSKQKPKDKPKPKPQPEPEPEPQLQADDDNYNQDNFQPQQPEQPQNPGLSQQQLQPHLKRLSGLYKLNPQRTLKQFGKYDKRDGFLIQQKFKKALEPLFSNLKKQEQRQRIIQGLFQSASTDDGIVWYNDWLVEISQNYEPVKITDPDWKIEEKKEKKQPQLIKKVSKVKVVEPKVDPHSEVLIGPSSEVVGLDIIGDVMKGIKQEPDEKKVSIKSIKDVKDTDKEEKRGDNLPEVFLANEIVAVMINGVKPRRSDALLQYIEYDKKQVDAFYKTAEKAKLEKDKYKDPSFGHKLEFLRKSYNPKVDGETDRFKEYSWTHVSKVWKTPLAFKNAIQPHDIKQGQLGDCYFLSALACIAEYSNLIERVFEYQDENNSIFGIWLCLDGVWTLISLDGWIVTSNRQGKPYPAFSDSVADEEFWVMLLEKAYAKAFGSFKQIESGHPIEAIRDLTGAPGQIFNHIPTNYPPDKLWTLLIQADLNKFMMTAGTDPRRKGKHVNGKEEKVTDRNIVLGHAYSILALAELNTGQKLIQMRNPWGNTQYESDWSDNGKRWTPELKSMLNYKDQNDGIFWMSFPDYYNEFNVTSINFIRPSYYYKNKIYNEKAKQFVIVVDHFSHGYITVTQRDERHQANKQANKKSSSYPTVDYEGVFERSNKSLYEIEKIHEKYSRGLRDTCLEVNIKQKDQKLYLITTLQQPFWCNVCYYGKQNISFSIQPLEKHLDNILMNIDGEETLSNGNYCKVVVKYFRDLLFFRVRNIVKKKVEYAMEINSFNNLVIVGDIKNNMKWKLILEPGETKIVKYRQIKVGEETRIGSYSVLAQLVQ